MDDAEHREVAEWLAELADLREAHAALRRSAAFSAVAVDRAEASAALCMAHVQALEAAIPAIELTRDEALARANAWYRRPAVWLTLGFAGGIAATLAVAL
jgi:hypothetical protein